MADGHTATTSGTTSFEARIGALDIKFEATILDNLYFDALLGHDFLVNNEVSWDYAAYTIHMGRQICTSTCWKGKSQPPATSSDLSQLEFGNDTETRAKLTEILNKYAVVFNDKVGRTKLIEHEILLKDPCPQQKQAAIDDMVRDMETQGLVEPSISPWAAPVVLAKKKDGTFRLCVDYRWLNDVTESNAYPMLDLNKIIRRMRSAKIFSIFDLSTRPGNTKRSTRFVSPALGSPIDEERLEEKLVGAPTTPTTNIDLESDRIFSMVNNHDSDDTPLIATTLGKWQPEDATIHDVIAGHRWDGPTRNNRCAKSETNKYVFSDDLLRVNVGPHTPVVIPTTKIQHVIWRCHDHALSSHPGWKETYRAVQQRYYWKGQKNDVRLYVGAYHVCACTKPLNSRPNDPMQPRTPHQPWEVTSVDLMGSYPRSGNQDESRKCPLKIQISKYSDIFYRV
ncbi:hypothetical protein QTP88_014416 [Uroleucon formosanum]